MKKFFAALSLTAALCAWLGSMSAFADEDFVVSDIDDDLSYNDTAAEQSDIDIIEKALKRTSYAAIPKSYDSRQHGLDIPVRDQGESYVCWSFAACAAAESWAVLNGFEKEDSVDFSEAQIAWFGGRPNSGGSSDGFNVKSPFNTGGSVLTNASVLSSWSGFDHEEYAAFPKDKDSFELSENMRYSSKYRLKSIDFLDGCDAAAIKSAVIEKGGVAAAYYSHDDAKYFSKDYKSYYCDEVGDTNHSVFIIGWDDNYSRQNFGAVKPKADGAWLVRGSWGSNIGDNGCYWISYEESEIDDLAAYEFYDADELDNNYTYNSDGLGGILSLDVTYQANVFKAKGDETIKAVSFYTYQNEGSERLSYTIDIYKGIKWGGAPDGGTLASSVSGTLDVNGFHTVDLKKLPKVTEGEVFSVVLKLYGADGTVGALIENSKSTMHSNEGESYISDDGENWYSNKRLPVSGGTMNVNNNCINVYTVDNFSADKSFLEYLADKCTDDEEMKALVNEAEEVIADENASKADVERAQAHILSLREELAYFEVRFTDINGKLIKSQKVRYGSAATAPTAPAVSNKAFTGWSADYSKVKGDMTVQAQYKDLIPISKATVTGVVSKTYSGSALQQDIKVVYGKKTLVLGRDYTVSYQNNINAGTAKLVIYGKGDFSGSVVKSFTILPISSSRLTVVFSAADRIYTGSDIKPSVSVKSGSKVLKKNSDYTVTYTQCKNIGKACVKIVFKGNYSGTVCKYFKIVPKTVPSKTTFTCTSNAVRINWHKVLNCSGYKIYRYNGKSWVAVGNVSGNSTVSFKDSGLRSGKEYKYKVKAYKTVGGVTYFGQASKTVTAATRPAKTAINKSYSSSSAARIYWKKTECTGYQIFRYSSAQKKYVKVVVVSNSSPLTFRQGGLKRNTVYKYKLRAYKKTSAGKYIFGAFSNVISVRTK